VSFQEFSLHPQVLAGVKSVGFTTPTPIQQQAIPVALQGRDLLGLAQTGTGKTAAFALPILHHLATTPPKRGIRCLVLAPTRELAEQILQSFRELGQHLGIRSIAVYGGVSKGPQLAGIRRGAQIVVACPGRLLDHMSQKDINLSQVEILVLDEADTMCDMGFLPDVRRILDQVPAERQTLFFSATMPSEIRSLAVKILKDPEMVQIGAIAPAKTVSHAIYPVPDKLKRDLLLALLQQTPTGRALIFTRTKHRARTLALELAKKSFRVAALQGNMSQNARQQAMDGFRAGRFDIMVATDIAAHGIDVPEVSHVINFDFPNTADTYLHRIGRTGRAEHTGEALTFAGADDANMVREVERELGLKIERRRLAGFDYGEFTPEEQFREDRMGLNRAGGQSNGGRAGRSTRDSRQGNGRNAQNNAQNSRQNNNRRNGASNNGSRTGQAAPSGPRTDSNSGNRSAEPAPRTGASNGRRFEQPVGRTSRTGASDGRRSEQPVGRPSRTDSPNGRSPGQILGRAPISEAESRRRSGQLLGRSTSPDSPNGRRKSPSQGAPSFNPRPPRSGKPGKPRGLRRSAARQ
jgi:ATP-dependent RNA helicase RhlE